MTLFQTVMMYLMTMILVYVGFGFAQYTWREFNILTFRLNFTFEHERHIIDRILKILRSMVIFFIGAISTITLLLGAVLLYVPLHEHWLLSIGEFILYASIAYLGIRTSAWVDRVVSKYI
jgi:hypothetical protein